MNFSSMEYFAALARERNFTRAAEQLHITQQSLSTHIAGLEKELGCKLLIRHVPMELTYAGEVFLRYALSFQQKRTAMLHEFCDISQPCVDKKDTRQKQQNKVLEYGKSERLLA